MTELQLPTSSFADTDVITLHSWFVAQTSELGLVLHDAYSDKQFQVDAREDGRMLRARMVGRARSRVVVLAGSVDKAAMAMNDAPIEVIQAFRDGFPINWKEV